MSQGRTWEKPLPKMLDGRSCRPPDPQDALSPSSCGASGAGESRGARFLKLLSPSHRAVGNLVSRGN